MDPNSVRAGESFPTLIRTEIGRLAVESGQTPLDEYPDDMLIADTGLDSLDFAMLVAKLEEVLGFDPFVELRDAIYPTTVGGFIEVYQRHG